MPMGNSAHNIMTHKNLSQMPEEVAKKFLRNVVTMKGVDSLHRVLLVDDYRLMVSSGFDWVWSPEGFDYWNDVQDMKFPDEYITITLPKPQSELLVNAAKSLRYSLSHFDEAIHHERFDLTTLEALMHYEVSIKISKRDLDKFTSTHGVDFPEY